MTKWRRLTLLVNVFRIFIIFLIFTLCIQPNATKSQIGLKLSGYHQNHVREDRRNVQLFLKTFFVKLILELDAIIEWLTGHVDVTFAISVKIPLLSGPKNRVAWIGF